MIETSKFDKRLLNLTSTIYLGYYYRHDLVKITQELKDNSGTDVMAGLKLHERDPGYVEINKMWQDAEFNTNAMQWINYYPGKDFTQDLVDDVASYLRLDGVHRAWISRVDPGYMAPWHWDVDDNEDVYLQKGPIKRYSITMCAPTMGHIFVIGDDYIYGVPAGSIFKWKNHREWHTGINAGMSPKFTLHVLGY